MKVNKLLARCRIAPAKTIAGLSQRQRDERALLAAEAGTPHGAPQLASVVPKSRLQPR